MIWAFEQQRDVVMSVAVGPLLALLAAATPVAAPDPLIGQWRNPDGSVTMRIADCHGRLCGTVVRASTEAIADARDGGTPHLIGTEVMHGYRRESPTHWSGVVFVPDLGHSFSSHVDLIDATHARVAGCLLGRFVCLTQVWVRE